MNNQVREINGVDSFVKSTVLVLQSATSQQLAATLEYHAFGNVLSQTVTWAGPFGYASKFGYQSPSIPGATTPDTGITLMGHRYYDPSTRRFLTRDPIFDGRNWYKCAGGEGIWRTYPDQAGLCEMPPAPVADNLLDGDAVAVQSQIQDPRLNIVSSGPQAGVFWDIQNNGVDCDIVTPGGVSP